MYNYEKQNFSKGQILKAEHLNYMEAGIEKALNRNYITPSDFNCLCDGVTNDLNAFNEMIEYACFNNLPIIIDKPIYLSGIVITPKDATYCYIKGIEKANIILDHTTETYINIKTDGAIVENLNFKTNYTGTNSLSIRSAGLVIDSSNVSITNCFISNTKFGIWIANKDLINITNIKIHNCDIKNINIGVLVGNLDENSDERTDTITNIEISNCSITDGLGQALGTLPFSELNDGIKIARRCSDIRIISNHIERMKTDAIDGYTSGDSLIITNNILIENGLVGIELKRSDDAYPEYLGKNNNVIIANNIISKNEYGALALIRIENEEEIPQETFKNTIVTGNIIKENKNKIMSCNHNNCIVDNNIFENNYGNIVFSGINKNEVYLPQTGCIFSNNILTFKDWLYGTTENKYILYIGDYTHISVYNNHFDTSNALENHFWGIGCSSLSKSFVENNTFIGNFRIKTYIKANTWVNSNKKIRFVIPAGSYENKILQTKVLDSGGSLLCGGLFVNENETLEVIANITDINNSIQYSYNGDAEKNKKNIFTFESGVYGFSSEDDIYISLLVNGTLQKDANVILCFN